MGRMPSDARKDVGEPGLRIDAVHLRGDDEAYPFGGGRLALISLLAIAV